MGKKPILNVTKSGKRYFIVNGRKIFIKSHMTKDEVLAIYKLLKKSGPIKRKKKIRATNVNQASAVINQYVSPQRRRRKRDANVTGINPLNRVSVSSGESRHPKDSGDKDLINSLINTVNKTQSQTPLLVDYSENARIAQLAHDPYYLKFNQSGQPMQESDIYFLANKYGLTHHLESKSATSGLMRASVDLGNEYQDEADLREIPQDQPLPEAYQPQPEQDQPLPEQDQPLPEAYQPEQPEMRQQEQEEKPQEAQEEENKEEMKQEVMNPDTVDFSILKKVVNLLKKEGVQLTQIHGSAKDKPATRNTFKDEVLAYGISDVEVNKAYNKVLQKLALENAQQAKWEEKAKAKARKQKTQALLKAEQQKQRKKFLSMFPAEPGHVVGSGSSSRTSGLYDDEIDSIMSKFQDFKGCIMRDEIKKLLPHIKPQSRIAFIINTAPHDKQGKHWNAVYVDARDCPESSNSLEWFDSFGRPMPPDILEDCKLILHCLKPNTVLKVKENHVVHQKDETSNCGYFCCKFLIDRFRGKSFAEASGYDDRIKINHSNQNEKEIENLKNKPPFSYICV